MFKEVLLKIVFWLLVNVTVSTDSHCYFVKPSYSDGFNSTCPTNSTHSTCRTLQDYVRNSFSSNSVVIFLPGNHALTGKLNIQNVYNLSLMGQISGKNSAVINCTNDRQTGMAFINATDIYMTNLVLLHCGGNISSERSNISGLLLQTVTNICISNVAIASGKGIGLYAYNCSGILHIHSSKFRNNSGGNLKLKMKDYKPSNHWNVLVNHSVIEDGHSEIGGGVMFESRWHSKSYNECLATDGNVFEIISTNFTRNTANKYAGAFFARLFASDCMPSKIMFIDCRFVGNTVIKFEGHGSAITISKHTLPAFYNPVNDFPLHKISIVRSLFYNNCIQGTQPSVVELGNVKRVAIANSTFICNSGTAISMRASNVIFTGSINFTGNRGIDGGALKFCDSSVMFLNNDTTLTFQDNFAENTGGAIFVQDSCLDQPSACFFQPYTSISVSDIIRERHIKLIFINNTANLAGDSIYGGRIDHCFTFANLMNSHPSELFDTITSFTPNQMTRQIASDPYEILFCDAENNPIRNNTLHMMVVPGRPFHVNVVATGQRYGTIPAAVYVDVPAKYSNKTTLFMNNYVPSRECSIMNLTLLTQLDPGTVVQLTFSVQHSSSQRIFSEYNKVLDINIEECPWGFLHHAGKCECLIWQGPNCNPLISHNTKLWIGCIRNLNESSCKNKALVYSRSDQFNSNYFVLGVQNVTEDTVDEQCAEGRTGTLCGSCVKGRSVVLGTGKCKVCPKSNAFLSLIVVYLGSGILLVAVITKFRLTVTNGSLNGLIFYANFVHWNRNQFFPDFINANLLRILIAWLNLDFGIEVCFYNEMTALQLMWLEIGYVFYLFSLQVIIVLLCRKYIAFTRLFGRTITKAMSTLLIILFGKMVRMANDALYRATVHIPANKTNFNVLLIDGNVKFLSKHHIPLMVVAIIIVASLLLFTFYLLFNQILIRISGNRCFKWVARLQPFFDTITGPCNRNYTFWPGFLFLVKIAYFCFLYTIRGPKNKLYYTATFSMSCLIFSFLGPKGVYKKWSLNILELTLLLNLGITCILITFSSSKMRITFLSHFSVGIALVIFLTYHFYEQRWLRYVKKLLLNCAFIFLNLLKSSKGEESSQQVVTHTEVVMSPAEHAPLLSAQLMPPVINYGILREPLLENMAKQETAYVN